MHKQFIHLDSRLRHCPRTIEEPEQIKKTSNRQVFDEIYPTSSFFYGLHICESDETYLRRQPAIKKWKWFTAIEVISNINLYCINIELSLEYRLLHGFNDQIATWIRCSTAVSFVSHDPFY